MKKAWTKYAFCVALIITIVLLISYFTPTKQCTRTDLKALEAEIELMDRLTTALQSIMDDIDNSLEWNRRAKQEPPAWWWELEKEE